MLTTVYILVFWRLISLSSHISSLHYTSITMSIIALTVVALATLNEVSAQSGYCYDRFGRRYRCNGGGLGYGARIGIGVGIAAGKLTHIGCWSN